MPIGEDSESYLIEVRANGETVRAATVSTPTWDYSFAQMDEDAVLGSFEVAISQISARFGPGPSVTITASR